MSAQPLAGKVALVTGGSKGIGRAICIKFVSLGAKVLINYAGDDSAAHSLTTLLGPESSHALKADVSSVASISQLVEDTIAHFGHLDIVVACAGISIGKELSAVTEEDFDKTFNLNVKGPLFLVQKAAPHMPPSSRIILFSSTLCHASTVSPGQLTYVSSKGAVEQMTRILCKDLARKGITVNTVAPGPTATDLFLTGKTEAQLDFFAKLTPFGRIGTPEEITGVVAFLAGPDSGWVTGQVIKVNGGVA